MKAHPGFKAVQAQIAREQGVSPKAAGAILASSSRNASPAAKRKNPRLNRVSKAKKAPKPVSLKAPKSSSLIRRAMTARTPDAY